MINIRELRERTRNFIESITKDDYDNWVLLEKNRRFFNQPKQDKPTKKWIKETIVPVDYEIGTEAFNKWSTHVHTQAKENAANTDKRK